MRRIEVAEDSDEASLNPAGAGHSQSSNSGVAGCGAMRSASGEGDQSSASAWT